MPREIGDEEEDYAKNLGDSEREHELVRGKQGPKKDAERDAEDRPGEKIAEEIIQADFDVVPQSVPHEESAGAILIDKPAGDICQANPGTQYQFPDSFEKIPDIRPSL
jgi:hypothetical protein